MDGWLDGYRVRLGALGRDKSWISPCGLEIEDWELGIGIIGLLDTYLGICAIGRLYNRESFERD